MKRRDPNPTAAATPAERRARVAALPALRDTDAALIERFIERAWAEDGLARHSQAAYRSDLQGFARWLAPSGPGLLEVARLREPEHIVRASSALLLAAVLDPQATRQTVIDLCDPKYVEASVAPPITIHYLALCAALCNVGDDGFVRLAGLTSKFPFEESQEDVLLALA